MVELAYALNGLAFAEGSRGAAVVKRGTCSGKSRKRSCVCCVQVILLQTLVHFSWIHNEISHNRNV